MSASEFRAVQHHYHIMIESHPNCLLRNIDRARMLTLNLRKPFCRNLTDYGGRGREWLEWTCALILVHCSAYHIIVSGRNSNLGKENGKTGMYIKIIFQCSVRMQECKRKFRPCRQGAQFIHFFCWATCTEKAPCWAPRIASYAQRCRLYLCFQVDLRLTIQLEPIWEVAAQSHFCANFSQTFHYKTCHIYPIIL